MNWDELYQQPFMEYVNAYKTEEQQEELQQQEINTNDNNEVPNEQQQDGAIESSEDKNTM